MIVLDASALVELLGRSAAGADVERRLDETDGRGHVPQLASVEVMQVLRRLVVADALPATRAAEAVEDLAALPVTRHDHEVLLPRVWELRHHLSAYDAVYVALAEGLGAPLVTLDAKLAAAPGHTAQIDLVVG